MDELGVEPKRSLGQNFLVSESVVARIMAEVKELCTGLEIPKVVEIGPGLGSLTEPLLVLQLNHVHLIELDSVFAEAWRRRAGRQPGLADRLMVTESDALRYAWEAEASPFVLVSNLPYQISSSIVIEMSLRYDRQKLFGLAGMVLMFQKEVAERIVAKASTPEYGLLSVVAQNFWRVTRVCDAGPRDFEPAPRVASRVLAFRPLVGGELLDGPEFLRFVKAGWQQRRKLLASNLVGSHASLQTRAHVDGWLESLDLPLKTRAEELSPEQWRRLFLTLPEES